MLVVESLLSLLFLLLYSLILMNMFVNSFMVTGAFLGNHLLS